MTTAAARATATARAFHVVTAAAEAGTP
jgi:hypothetical protein